jgi:hypothetical protein
VGDRGDVGGRGLTGLHVEGERATPRNSRSGVSLRRLASSRGRSASSAYVPPVAPRRTSPLYGGSSRPKKPVSSVVALARVSPPVRSVWSL